MSGRTALVVGATGLVGRALVRVLAADERFTRVVTFGRRASEAPAAKVEARVVDLGDPASFADALRGEVAFSCLGTTKKAAGSLEAQRVVDVDYPLAFAESAAANGVETFALVSSMGADASSRFAYMKMKGELDAAVAALPFARVRIARPSTLVGDRGEQARAGEHVAIGVGRALAAVGLFRRARPIEAETVARALVAAVFDGSEARRIYENDELFRLAGRDR
jgi:uncharacterized protein YbjT (DUF2867 family)